MQGQASLADLGRVIWRIRTLTRLPNERTSADYLSPDLEARVERITGEGPSRKSFLMLSADLMEHGGYAQRVRSESEIVRRAAPRQQEAGRAGGGLSRRRADRQCADDAARSLSGLYGGGRDGGRGGT
ncbi:hypothetical protein [Brevundimonas sp.]|uniref:hypothetical protein n=1 Tax=Brevundimonas sp. TaxID=1871086 RepID=UPI003B005F30